MPETMRDRALFGAGAVVGSLTLFAAVRWLGRNGASFSPQLVGFAVPVVAVMLAARGVGWRRKLAFAAATLGGLILIDVGAGWIGLTALTNVMADFESAPLASVLGLAYSIVPIVYSMAALMLFVGRRPSILWTGSPRRPQA